MDAATRDRAGVSVVGISENPRVAADDIARVQPDVVVVEAGADDDAAPVARLTLDGVRASSFVVLADEPARAWTASAVRAGVRAALPRDAPPRDIAAAIGAVAAGLFAIHPDVAAALAPGSTGAPRQSDGERATLTPREVEVLGMLASGMGNKHIARRLGISAHTVKFHVGSILAKLRAESRTEAVTLGVRQGLIML